MRYNNIKRYNKRTLYKNSEKKRRALKNIRIFFISQGCSILGSTIVSFTIIWYITLMSFSSMAVAISIVCTYTPQIIISIFSGVWGDKYNKKILIILGDIITAISTFILVVLFILGYKSMYLIYLLCIFRSIGSGIQTPLENAFISRICSKNLLQKVNSIYSMLNSVINIISPSIAALLLSWIDFEFILCIDFITAIIAILLLLKIKYKEIIYKENTSKSIFASFKDGINYLQTSYYLRNMIIFYLIFYFFMSVPGFLTPVLVSTKFSSDSIYLAINETIWFIGNGIGGFVMYKITSKSRLLFMAISCFLFGILVLGLGLSYTFEMYIVIMLLAGIVMVIFNTSNITIIQENTDRFMISRVFSNMNILTNIATIIGISFWGVVGNVLLVDSLLVISGICIIFLSLFIWKLHMRFNI